MKNSATTLQLATFFVTTATLLASPTIALGQKVAPTAAPTPAPPPAPAPAATAAPLPTADAIFARAVTASGGADLIRMQTSRTQTGTIEMAAQSLKGTIVTKSVDPNMLLIETDIPSFGKIRQGVNGTVGWAIDPMRGASLMTADEVARITRESSIAAELNPAVGCDAPVVEEQTSFGGEPCFKVKLKCGQDVSSRFYSVNSGLLIGSVASVKSSMGEFEVTTINKNFEAFSGRMIAKVQDNSMMGQVQTLTISAVDFGPIDPAAFALPPEIQALVKAAKNPSPAPTTPPHAPVAPTIPAKK